MVQTTGQLSLEAPPFNEFGGPFNNFTHHRLGSVETPEYRHQAEGFIGAVGVTFSQAGNSQAETQYVVTPSLRDNPNAAARLVRDYPGLIEQATAGDRPKILEPFDGSVLQNVCATLDRYDRRLIGGIAIHEGELEGEYETGVFTTLVAPTAIKSLAGKVVLGHRYYGRNVFGLDREGLEAIKRAIPVDDVRRTIAFATSTALHMVATHMPELSVVRKSVSQQPALEVVRPELSLVQDRLVAA